MFVAVEGPDGVGKTLGLAGLYERLTAEGVDFVATREPGGSPSLGGPLRQLVLHADLPITPRAEALLFAADRAQHMAELVVPALAAGRLVITDRFLDSSLAFQGIGRGLPLDQVEAVSMFATDGRLPDLVLVLHAPPEVIAARRAGRGTTDRIESAQIGDRVSEFLLRRAAADPGRYRVVDASGTPQETVGNLYRALMQAYEARAAA